MEAVGWGQADFDEPVGALSAEDRALLYAYWNQRRHLEELTEAFRQLFGTNRPAEPLIVVDLGCAPFTGGLALAGQLGHQEWFDYIGVDRSRTMRELGEQLAVAAESAPGTPRIGRHWAADISSVDWRQPPGWRPVIVIVSFLLASPTLQVETLMAELEHLLEKLSRQPGHPLRGLVHQERVRPDRHREAAGLVGREHLAPRRNHCRPADNSRGGSALDSDSIILTEASETPRRLLHFLSASASELQAGTLG